MIGGGVFLGGKGKVVFGHLGDGAPIYYNCRWVVRVG